MWKFGKHFKCSLVNYAKGLVVEQKLGNSLYLNVLCFVFMPQDWPEMLMLYAHCLNCQPHK